MRAELEALLALQADDEKIHELEVERDSIAPRLRRLDSDRQLVVSGLDQVRELLEAEEARERDLQTKAAEHRQLLERNQAQLETVKKTKEATAAMLQLDLARRMLSQTEADLQATQKRVVEARAALAAHEQSLAELDDAQATERNEISEHHARLEAALTVARAEREKVAGRVARPLLTKYDRIRSRRRVTAVFALRETSCGNCDTAIPMHRRSIMLNNGTIEMCEVCGVLLYATR